MKKWVWLGIFSFLFSFGLEAKLSRNYDPIVIKGSHLPAVKDSLVGELRLYSYQGGTFQPIVFQIDERYEDMLYWQWTRRRRELLYALNIGEEVKADPDPKFDQDDELAFMAFDLGERAPSGAVPAGADVCQEIKVGVPGGKEDGYAYLCRFKSPPPLIGKQYVAIAGANNQFIGQTYRLGYQTHELFFDQLQLGSGDKLSPNLIDRFKINVECFGAYGLLVYQLTNNDIRTHLRGFKVGPVRIIKEIVSITEPWAHVQNRLLHHIYFYPYHMEWEMETRGPIVWGPVHQFIYSMSLDMAPVVDGAKFYSDKNPVPVIVDGVYDEEEMKMNYGPQEWLAMSTQWGTIYSHLGLPLKTREKGRQLYPDLYYVDMEQKVDRPETYPGMFGKFGWKIKDIQVTGRKPVIFRLNYFFSPEPYQPDTEKNLVGIYTNSLQVQTDGNLGTAVTQSLPTPEEQRKPEDQPIATMATKQEVKQATWSILPNFWIDPYNVGYGAGLAYSNQDFLKSGIGFSISTMISTRNYYDLSVDVNKLTFIKFVEDFGISFGLKQFPSQSFYGIGNETDLDHQVIYWWVRNEAELSFNKHFAHHYGVGVQVFYRDTTIKPGQQPIEGTQVGKPSFEEHYGYWDELYEMQRWGGPLYGRDGGMTNGFNISFYRDMRDDTQVPHRGDYEAISIYRVGPEMGSDYDYTKLSTDLRVYFEPSWLQDLPMDHWFSADRTAWTKFFGPEKHRNISFRFAATHTFADEFEYYHQTVKDIPFYELTTYGGGSSNRGFYGNRFMDNDMIMASVEYRWQYWRFWDVALFFDVGRVMYDMTDSDWLEDPNLHYGYGISARGHMPPGVIVTIEYAFSPEFPSGYFNMVGFAF